MRKLYYSNLPDITRGYRIMTDIKKVPACEIHVATARNGNPRFRHSVHSVLT